MLRTKRLKELKTLLPKKQADLSEAEIEAIGLKIARFVLLKELQRQPAANEVVK